MRYKFALTISTFLIFCSFSKGQTWDDSGDDNSPEFQEYLRESGSYSKVDSGGYQVFYNEREKMKEHSFSLIERERCSDYMDQVGGWDYSGNDEITNYLIGKCKNILKYAQGGKTKGLGANNNIYRGSDGKFHYEEDELVRLEERLKANKSEKVKELEAIAKGEKSFKVKKVRTDEERISKGGDWKRQRLIDIANGKRKFTKEELEGGKILSHSEQAQKAETQLKSWQKAYSQYIKQQKKQQKILLKKANSLNNSAKNSRTKEEVKKGQKSKENKEKIEKEQPFYVDIDGKIKGEQSHGLSFDKTGGSEKTEKQGRLSKSGSSSSSKNSSGKGQFNPDGSLRFPKKVKEHGFSVYQSNFSNHRVNY